jgi:hypothetical protein
MANSPLKRILRRTQMIYQGIRLTRNDYTTKYRLDFHQKLGSATTSHDVSRDELLMSYPRKVSLARVARLRDEGVGGSIKRYERRWRQTRKIMVQSRPLGMGGVTKIETTVTAMRRVVEGLSIINEPCLTFVELPLCLGKEFHASPASVLTLLQISPKGAVSRCINLLSIHIDAICCVCTSLHRRQVVDNLERPGI